MDAKRELSKIHATLRAVGSHARAEGEKKYLKSDLTFLGVPVPEIRKTAKAYAKAHPDLTREDLIALSGAGWETNVHELRSVAIALLELKRDRLRASDLATLEGFLRRANTWAHVDWLVTGVVASLVERFASAQRRLDRWAQDDSFWMRRAALLALMPPMRRRDGGDFRGFEALAVPMLADTEFFIRKAIGWVLREASKTHPDRVVAFLTAHADAMSGLSIREACKRLPATTAARFVRPRPRR